MVRSRKEIEGLGVGQGVALFAQELHVPGQGGGVAGDVDDPGRGHGHHGVDDLRGQALSRRVHHDDVHASCSVILSAGKDPFFFFSCWLPAAACCPRSEALGGLAGVGAEEFHVFHAVPGGVFPGVLDGLGDDLHADDLSRPPGQGQGDGAGAAVEVQHRLGPVQLCQLHGLFIEPLGLIVVHLIERAGGEPEAEAAELVLDPVPAPEGAEFIPQHHVGIPHVFGEDHGGQARDLPLQGMDQAVFPGQMVPVHHQADHELPRDDSPAKIDMPQQALSGMLVIDGDPVLLRPAEHQVLDLIEHRG